MKRLTFPLTILMLILATVFLGGTTFYLLRHEEDRIRKRSLRETEFKAHAIAEKIADTVLSVQTDLLQALSSMDALTPVQILEREKNTNPLIRNVFIWQPGVGLIHPASSQWLSEEEDAFLSRYDRIFRETMPWWNTEERGSDEATYPSQSLKQQAQLNIHDVEIEKGWERWFWEDRLFLLGWVYPGPGMSVRGVEIEMMSLMSQILPQLDIFTDDGATYAIVDHNGALFHQIGSAEIDSKPNDADLWIPIGNALPQWQVGVFKNGHQGEVAGDRFLLITGLFLLMVVAAILLSGVSLFLTARRHVHDARQKSTFVSNVSHELKTPLTSIRMYAELLSQNRVKDPEKKNKLLDVIIDESCRLSRLVQNVLDFSRLEQGRKKYRRENTDVGAFVRRVIELQEHRIREHGMVLNIHIPHDPIRVYVDHDALEQVLLNVLDNAIKYGRSEQGENDLTITLYKDESRARMAIEDRGTGIPKSLENKIFEKFFRVDDTLTADQAGSGIGLSISRKLMRDMGGDLIYEPREGGGSRFALWISLFKEGTAHDE